MPLYTREMLDGPLGRRRNEAPDVREDYNCLEGADEGRIQRGGPKLCCDRSREDESEGLKGAVFALPACDLLDHVSGRHRIERDVRPQQREVVPVLDDEAEPSLESGRRALAQPGHCLGVIDFRSFETTDLEDVLGHGGGL